jgi:hypothetical protein
MNPIGTVKFGGGLVLRLGTVSDMTKTFCGGAEYLASEVILEMLTDK